MNGDRKANSTALGAIWPEPINWTAFVLASVKLNATDKHSEAIAREENTQLPAAVRVSETSVLKLSNGSYVVLAAFGKLSTLTSLALSLSRFSQSLTCK